MLETDPQITENKQKLTFIEKTRSLLSRYRNLYADEKTQFLEERYTSRLDGKVPFYISNLYPMLISDTESSNFFGYQIEDGALEDQVITQCIKELGISPFVIATHAFQTAIAGYTELRKDLSEFCSKKEDSRVGFPFRITKQRNFSVSSFGGGAELVGFGQDYLYAIARALLSGDEVALNETIISMETQFYHELLHQLSNEDNLNTGISEEMSLLGEFLYDPENNTERNAIFKQLCKFALDEEGTKAAGKWVETYDRAWQKVGIVILIHELIASNVLDESKLDDIEQVIQHLPMYYAQFTADRRTQILKRYITLNKIELYAECERMAQEHRLFFAL